MNFQLNELVSEWSRLVTGRVDCKFGHLLKAFRVFPRIVKFHVSFSFAFASQISDQ